jgi:hypothetical protein
VAGPDLTQLLGARRARVLALVGAARREAATLNQEYNFALFNRSISSESAEGFKRDLENYLTEF